MRSTSARVGFPSSVEGSTSVVAEKPPSAAEPASDALQVPETSLVREAETASDAPVKASGPKPLVGAATDPPTCQLAAPNAQLEYATEPEPAMVAAPDAVTEMPTEPEALSQLSVAL